jgi:hypothetical protein
LTFSTHQQIEKGEQRKGRKTPDLAGIDLVRAQVKKMGLTEIHWFWEIFWCHYSFTAFGV